MSENTSRRSLLKAFPLVLGAASLPGHAVAQAAAAEAKPAKGPFWPDGARLVISVSMQFEAGGEPDSGADSPFSGNPLPKGTPDLPAKTWFQYGYREGVPRMLDLWDEFGIKITSHMVGEAARRNPQLAREIVTRGHEAAGHGLNWSPQFGMSREEEKQFIAAGVKAVQEATGQIQKGYNCNWLRRSVNTLSILQELGFTYHIDDLSTDEPFIVPIDGKDFTIVPYTLRCNDIALIEGRHFSTEQFYHQLVNEFDQLYREGARRRVMMSLSTHDRIGGTPGMVQAMRRFFEYVAKHEGVRYARKDQIAAWARESSATLRFPEAT